MNVHVSIVEKPLLVLVPFWHMNGSTQGRNPMYVSLVGNCSLIPVPFDFMKWCTVERNI
jgi:hypothetical protein